MSRRPTIRRPELAAYLEHPKAVGPQQRLVRLQRHVTWTKRDLQEFSEALAAQRMIDTGAWR